MKFGFLSLNTASGILPGSLGIELENRGFESLWFPEHSHIPITSVASFPDPTRTMPDGYAHMMNPFVSMAAAGATTKQLKLATGMALGLEHDLLDLASTLSSLDVLTQGRVIAGFGVGWDAQAFAHARGELPFKRRYSVLKDRVAALRAAWSSAQTAHYTGPYSNTSWGQQISSYQGTYDAFEPSWVFPKPIGPSIPIALGVSGPTGIKHTIDYADIWGPVDSALRDAKGHIDVAGAITRFRDLLQAQGRSPDAVSITLFNIDGLDAKTVEYYASLPIERLVVGPPTFDCHSEAETLKALDNMTSLIAQYGTT